MATSKTHSAPAAETRESSDALLFLQSAHKDPTSHCDDDDIYEIIGVELPFDVLQVLPDRALTDPRRPLRHSLAHFNNSPQPFEHGAITACGRQMSTELEQLFLVQLVPTYLCRRWYKLSRLLPCCQNGKKAQDCARALQYSHIRLAP